MGFSNLRTLDKIFHEIIRKTGFTIVEISVCIKNIKMIYFFTLLCCLSCFIHVASFIFIPWPIIIFDDAGNDASGNVYTPFLENQPRAPENNRMRRPQPPVTNMRPLLPRNPQNRLYPSRQQVATPQNTIKYITPYVR